MTEPVGELNAGFSQPGAVADRGFAGAARRTVGRRDAQRDGDVLHP